MAGKFWTKSWSPIVGCQKCSPGCNRCWALPTVQRIVGATSSKFTCNGKNPLAEMAETIRDGSWTGKHVLVKEWIDRPTKWRKSRVISTGWLGDMWDPDVPDFLLDRVWSVIAGCCLRNHYFLLLTKRAIRMSMWAKKNVATHLGWPDCVWFGTTICTQEDAEKRILPMTEIQGMRWACIEPILEPVVIPWKSRILHPGADPCAYMEERQPFDWIVVGQETGSRFRPAKAEWINSIIAEAKKAGVPVWTKSIPPGVKPVRQAPKRIAEILMADNAIAGECSREGVKIEAIGR